MYIYYIHTIYNIHNKGIIWFHIAHGIQLGVQLGLTDLSGQTTESPCHVVLTNLQYQFPAWFGVNMTDTTSSIN